MRVDLFQDRVYVLSPKGEIVDVPVGGTPLDFAYQVHTDLGHRTRGAKVNGRMVTLDYQLKNSDTVEIITAKTAQPSRDWLSPRFLASPRHRNKVRAWFRKQNESQNKLEGRAMLDRELQRLGVHSPPMPELLSELKLTSSEALHEALGLGEISAAQVAGAIQRLLHAREARPLDVSAVRARAAREPEIDVQGIGDLLSTFARCCKPVPPEPIAGYITVGRGVSIHSQSCQNLARLSVKAPARVLPVAWGEISRRRISRGHRGAGIRSARTGARRECGTRGREDQHPEHEHGDGPARPCRAHADRNSNHRSAAALAGIGADRAAAQHRERQAQEIALPERRLTAPTDCRCAE